MGQIFLSFRGVTIVFHRRKKSCNESLTVAYRRSPKGCGPEKVAWAQRPPQCFSARVPTSNQAVESNLFFLKSYCLPCSFALFIMEISLKKDIWPGMP